MPCRCINVLLLRFACAYLVVCWGCWTGASLSFCVAFFSLLLIVSVSLLWVHCTGSSGMVITQFDACMDGRHGVRSSDGLDGCLEAQRAYNVVAHGRQLLPDGSVHG